MRPRSTVTVVGAIVVEPNDETTARSAAANRARALRRALAWDPRTRLPKGALRRLASALGVNAVTAGRRPRRLRENLAPLEQGVRLAGRLRCDTRAGLC